MSTATGKHEQPSIDVSRLIDRLVDGELNEVERRNLLQRLDTEPLEWRRCALAFMEAQTWRAAMMSVAAPAIDAFQPFQPPKSITPKRHIGRAAARFATLAASLLLAFWLGHAWHSQPKVEATTPPVEMANTSDQGVQPQGFDPAPNQLVAKDEVPEPPPEVPSALDATIKHWEQRGFQAQQETRTLSISLKDGRKVAVPVQGVRLEYIRGRTY